MNNKYFYKNMIRGRHFITKYSLRVAYIPIIEIIHIEKYRLKVLHPGENAPLDAEKVLRVDQANLGSIKRTT